MIASTPLALYFVWLRLIAASEGQCKGENGQCEAASASKEDNIETSDLVRSKPNLKGKISTSASEDSDDMTAALQLLLQVPSNTHVSHVHIGSKSGALEKLVEVPDLDYERQGPVMHRFCNGGREMNLCSIIPRFWSSSFSNAQKDKLPLELRKPVERKGNLCLQLTSVVANTPQECKNYETALQLLSDDRSQFNLTSYLSENVPNVTEDFWILAKWSQPPEGNHWVMREFRDDEYDMGHLNLTRGGLVLDVGSNVGIFSIVAAKLYPRASVVAFEPHPLNFLLAVHNVAANGLQDRVKVVGQALTAHGDFVTMSYNDDNPGGSTAEYGQHPTDVDQSGSTTFSVPSVTFANVLQTYDRHQDGFALKLDCEGCEYEIFANLQANQNRVRTMRGEIHAKLPSTREAATPLDILSFFKKKASKFECRWCNTTGL